MEDDFSRGSNILVFKDDSFQEVLIQKRSMEKKRSPGKFCTPGGSLKFDETHIDGAKREFFEEMFNSGKIDDSFKFEKLFEIDKTKNEHIEVFRTVSKGPFSPDPKEVEGAFFENISILMEKINESPENYTSTTRLLLKEYKKRYM